MSKYILVSAYFKQHNVHAPYSAESGSHPTIAVSLFDSHRTPTYEFKSGRYITAIINRFVMQLHAGRSFIPMRYPPVVPGEMCFLLPVAVLVLLA